MPGTRPNVFDRYVVVDWSARNAPATGADSIWIADLAASGEVRLDNPPTRQAAFERLAELFDHSRDQRLLVGFDASLGYPGGTSGLLGLDGTPWEAIWGLVAELATDDERNRNNRFTVAAELNRRIGVGSGPFWGCPRSYAGSSLAATKPKQFPTEQFRIVERRLKLAGRHPASGWQLFGAGSVGGQTLTLLARLAAARAAYGHRVAVWPFTTGLAVPDVAPGGVVIAEVWPTLFYPGRGGHGGHGGHGGAIVKDAAQVRATASRLRDADVSGQLRSWLAPSLDESQRLVVTDEEGWVLGVGRDTHLRCVHGRGVRFP